MKHLLSLFALFCSLITKAQDTTGITTMYHENGNKKSEGEYYGGFKIGFWQTWYEDGTLRSKENYSKSKELIDGINKDGIVSQGYNFEFSKFFVDSLGVLEGKSEWFYRNGQRCAEEIWGKSVVAVKHWDEKGKKQKVVEELNQLPIGIMESPKFNPNRVKELGKIWELKKADSGTRGVLQVTLDANRKIINLELTRSTGYEHLDNMILKMANEETNWTVCKIHHLPTSLTAILILNFNGSN